MELLLQIEIACSKPQPREAILVLEVKVKQCLEACLVFPETYSVELKRRKYVHFAALFFLLIIPTFLILFLFLYHFLHQELISKEAVQPGARFQQQLLVSAQVSLL